MLLLRVDVHWLRAAQPTSCGACAAEKVELLLAGNVEGSPLVLSSHQRRGHRADKAVSN